MFKFKKSACLWIGPQEESLDWCRHRLESFMPVLHVQSIDEINDAWPPLTPTQIVVASASRQDDLQQTFRAAEKMWKETPLSIVLGSSWSGHRRTQPLDEKLLIYYWYDLFNSLIPDWQSDSLSPKPATGSRSRKLGDSTTARTQNVELLQKDKPRLARIITNSLTADLRSQSTSKTLSSSPLIGIISTGQSADELWQDTLSSMGYATVQADSLETLPRGKFSCLLLDLPKLNLEKSAGENPQSMDYYSRLRRMFPTLPVLMIDAFPIAEQWKQWNDPQTILLPSPHRYSACEFWLRLAVG